MRVSAAHKKKQILPAYKQGELTCQFEGDPVSITWRKVGLRTLPNRMVPRMDKLNILGVDMRDSGTYKCMAYDGFSTAEAEINVTVNGEYESWPTKQRSRVGLHPYISHIGRGGLKREWCLNRVARCENRHSEIEYFVCFRVRVSSAWPYISTECSCPSPPDSLVG